MAISITAAGPGDAAGLAAVAAATFPLACPESVAAADVDAFVAEHLSAECFAKYLANPDHVILVARDDRLIIGYAMLIRRDTGVEISKMYVLQSHHSTGAAGALMQSGIDWAANGGAATVWLGVNQKNTRAQRFYRKCGFEVTGTRTFQLGASTEEDFVMGRTL